MGDLPRSAEELTAAWLTDALRSRGVIADAVVTSARAEVLGAGVGFIGQLARVHLSYDGAAADAPATLISKFPTLDPGGRQVGNTYRFYEREVRFYDEVAPKCGVRVPRCYYSAADVPGDQYVLLIEDLAPARVGDDLAGCTPEDVELAVRSIAKFHANWWEHRDLDRMEWLPSINDPVQQQAQPGYQQCWDPFSQMMGAALSPRMLSTGEALQHHIIGLQDLLNRAPRTISHGDFRADNMFFGGGGTSAFALADWQISTKGRGAFDLAYLFSGALDPSVRKAHEMRLLRLWHNLLVEAGVTGYSFDEALRDYRIGVLYSWMYVVIGVASLDPANERGMAFFNAWVLRRSRAVEELEAADLMPK